MTRRLSLRTVVASAAGLLALLSSTPLAAARHSANQVLNVTFFINGTIAVTLPDGTAVGSTSGAPTTIPAGSYTVQEFGPGGCSQLPFFDLKGPGVNVGDNMTGGEIPTESYNVTFAPSSTYTWRVDNVTPVVVHTFVTSADAGGGTAQTATQPVQPATSKPTSQDIVGSRSVQTRGRLTIAIGAAGTVTVRFHGRPVHSLGPGRYVVAVADASGKAGVVLRRQGGRTIALSGGSFVGTRTVTVELAAGTWLLGPRAPAPGASPSFVVA